MVKVCEWHLLLASPVFACPMGRSLLVLSRLIEREPKPENFLRPQIPLSKEIVRQAIAHGKALIKDDKIEVEATTAM